VGKDKRLPEDTTATTPNGVFSEYRCCHNLERWLVSDDHNTGRSAGCLATRVSFSLRFRGNDRLSWILAIVLNTALVRLSCNRGSDLPAEFDEKVRASDVELHGLEADAVRYADRVMIRTPLEPLDYDGIDSRKQEAQIAMRSFLSFPNDPAIVYLLQSESMFCGFPACIWSGYFLSLRIGRP
jgi:hypothetical protein